MLSYQPEDIFLQHCPKTVASVLYNTRTYLVENNKRGKLVTTRKSKSSPTSVHRFCSHQWLTYDSQYTGVWKYSGVYKRLHCLSKIRLYTKMLRIHLFSIFTIKTPRTLNREDTDTCTLTITYIQTHNRLVRQNNSDLRKPNQDLTFDLLCNVVTKSPPCVRILTTTAF